MRIKIEYTKTKARRILRENFKGWSDVIDLYQIKNDKENKEIVRIAAEWMIEFIMKRK